MADDHVFTGGCLCGEIRFETIGPALNPHTCSCEMCRRHSGVLTAAWVEFPASAVSWTGPGGAPTAYRSSDYSSRVFCRTCGSSIGAIDDDPVVALLVGAFDVPDQSALAPSAHSFADDVPRWWKYAGKQI